MSSTFLCSQACSKAPPSLQSAYICTGVSESSYCKRDNCSSQAWAYRPTCSETVDVAISLKRPVFRHSWLETRTLVQEGAKARKRALCSPCACTSIATITGLSSFPRMYKKASASKGGASSAVVCGHHGGHA